MGPRDDSYPQALALQSCHTHRTIFVLQQIGSSRACTNFVGPTTFDDLRVTPAGDLRVYHVLSGICDEVFAFCGNEQKKQNNFFLKSILYKKHQQCQNTFNKYKKVEEIKNPYFLKIRFQNDQRFMKIFIARLWRA